MRVNTNHPSFISFLETVTSNILTNVSVDSYFSLNQEKKLGVQYMVLKLIKSSVNEESENYEFAAILNDISKNFDKVNEVTNTKKRITRKIKTDTSKNG
jgi:hypothetical protein